MARGAAAKGAAATAGAGADRVLEGHLKDCSLDAWIFRGIISRLRRDVFILIYSSFAPLGERNQLSGKDGVSFFLSKIIRTYSVNLNS